MSTKRTKILENSLNPLAYFNMWCADKEAIIATMVANMTDDINAGYDPNGLHITAERIRINNYKAQYDALFELLTKMLATSGAPSVEVWCKRDMIRRGTIEDDTEMDDPYQYLDREIAY